MRTTRLEAFSDGVLAIIITVMVLELRVPEGTDLAALLQSTGTGLLSYVLSFLYVGIYWNNHHHMFQLTERINGATLWGNLHLLFWLSLLPFTTAWMDDSHYVRVPVMVYGINLLGAAIAFAVLQSVIMRAEGAGSPLRRALGRDVKGRVSLALYGVGILAAWFVGGPTLLPTVLALACFVVVAVLWLVPDRRMERVIVERGFQD